LALDQVVYQRRESVIPTFGPSIFDDDVLVLYVAEIAQTLTKCLDKIGLEGSGRVPEVTYSVDLPCLLGLGGDW
jgi:hypothetical protein